MTSVKTALTLVFALVVLGAQPLAAQRGGGGGSRGGGGGGASRGGGGGGGGASAGTRSTARTSVNSGSSASRAGGTSASRAGGTNASRNTSVNNTNRNTNIDNSTNVNRNTNVNIEVDDNDWNGGCCYNDYDHPVARAAAVTTAVAVTAAAIGSIVYSVPPSCVPVVVNGMTYQQCGSTWYQPSFNGTQTTYVVVNAP